MISFGIFILLHKVELEFEAGLLKWKNVCLLLKYNNFIGFCTCCLIVWFGETISLTRCCVTVGRALSLTALMCDSWNKCSNHKLLLFRNRVAIRALFAEIPKKRHVKELMARISGDLLCKTGVISVLHLTTSQRDWITRTCITFESTSMLPTSPVCGSLHCLSRASKVRFALSTVPADTYSEK